MATVTSMAGRRQIDIQRDSAVTLHIGGADDTSAVHELLSTGDGLYVIKGAAIFKVQLADDIDPKRTNPNIPNVSQQVLDAGHDNEIVARILLTAKYLFDENSATVKPFAAKLLENCILLTRQVFELDAMVRELVHEIEAKEAALAEKPSAPNSFRLPSIPDLDTKVHNLLVKADKAKDAALTLYQLKFLSGTKSRPKLSDLSAAVESAMQAEPELVASWQETSKYFGLVRNMRNASEHPKENHRVVLSDFRMWPDGKVYAPHVEVQHTETPIRSLPLVELLTFVRDSMVGHAERSLAFIRVAVLLDANPFGESVAEFPEDQRRHKHVRYYRSLNLDGTWRILG